MDGALDVVGRAPGDHPGRRASPPHPDADIEESIARLLIDGLAIRFGEWVKASEPAARFDQLSSAARMTRQLKVASTVLSRWR